MLFNTSISICDLFLIGLLLFVTLFAPQWVKQNIHLVVSKLWVYTAYIQISYW